MKPTLGWIAVTLLLLAPCANAALRVVEPKIDTGKYRELAAELQSDGVLQSFADEVNAAIELPAEVGLRFSECGQVNAFYDPGKKLISMCFELAEHYVNVMSSEYPDPEAALAAAEGAFTLVMFHELGHALVDVLELPITGREEDAVDQLAAWAMIDNGAGDQAVLNAALSYYRNAERAGGQFNLNQFADEHSLSLQRFFNLVCWVYGSNPQQYADLVNQQTLPSARAQRCPAEYAQIDRSWSALLEPATE